MSNVGFSAQLAAPGEATSGVAYHEKIANTWESRYQSGSFRRRYRFIERAVLSAVPGTARCLDAGCGTGTFSRLLADLGATDVSGVDASAEMVRQAELNAQSSAHSASFNFRKIASIESLPFDSESFDHAICFSVLEYVSDVPKALRELGRVVRNDGTCVVSIPHTRSALRRFQNLLGRLAAVRRKTGLSYLESSSFTLDPRAAEELFEAAGFCVERMLGFDPFAPSLLHRVVPPSLMFYRLRKIRQAGFSKRVCDL